MRSIYHVKQLSNETKPKSPKSDMNKTMNFVTTLRENVRSPETDIQKVFVATYMV